MVFLVFFVIDVAKLACHQPKVNVAEAIRNIARSD
jgi:hypothetical protein